MKIKLLTLILFLFIFNNLYALDTNKYYLDGIYSPSTICSQSGGNLSSNFSVADFDETRTYNDIGLAYAYYTTWLKNSTYNKKKVNYLIETTQSDQANPTTITLLYGFEKDTTDSNRFKLKFRNFLCECPSGVWDKFGMCKPDLNYKDFGSDLSATEICSNRGKIVGATGEFVQDTSASIVLLENIAQKEAFYKTWLRDGDNESKLFYAFKHNGSNWFMKWVSNPSRPIYQKNTMYVGYSKYSCSCPSGTDNLGLCLPFDCEVPQVEISDNICLALTNDMFCADGGLKQNGSCDRTCEDINQITVNGGGDVLNPSNEKICVDKVDCVDYADKCIQKCGSRDNIKMSTFTCTDLLVTPCACKDDELDQIVDNETPDETTDAGDSLLTNKYLKSIKDETQKQSELQDEIASLLYTQNENDLKKIDSLNSIDGKLSNIDSSINNMNDNLGDKLDTTNLNLEETNQHLQDIKQNQDDDQQYRDDKDSELENSNSNKDTKFGELSSKMAELETFGNDVISGVEGFVSDFNGLKSDFESGFTTNINTSTTISPCSTFSLWGQTITIDVCTFIGNFRNIFSLFIQVIILYFSLKVFILAFKTARG